MQLTEFQISNYRSINDSGPIKVGKITSLVGRNESGKSNLLLALQTLNPAGGAKDITPIKNFPRHRRLAECTDDTPVVSTTWELDPGEQAELAAIFPRATGVTQVKISRCYNASKQWVEFVALKPIAFSIDEVAARMGRIRPIVEVEADKLEETPQAQTKGAVQKLATMLESATEPTEWAAVAAPALAEFRKTLAAVAISLPDREEGLVAELENLAAHINRDGPAWNAARNWAVGGLPIFIYLEDYPELAGHQNIAEYLTRKAASPSKLTEYDRNFEKMCKVADLSPEELHKLLGANDHETRNQLTNRSSAIVTKELRRLWKDRPLKVRFSPDANHLDTFVPIQILSMTSRSILTREAVV